jgi:type 1 glutamine amidotransferase
VDALAETIHVLEPTDGANADRSEKNPARKPKLLVYSEIGKWRDPEHKLKGYYHESIPAGAAMLTRMAQEKNFEVQFTADSELFTDEGLAPFDALVFMNPNGYVLNADERLAFQKYIRGGKGYVGIHAAANCELDWPWYMKMIGAYETGVHANNALGKVRLVDAQHISTRNLPSVFEVKDEWLKYNLDVRTLKDEDFQVLATVDEDCYKPGATTHHAISWCREFEGGRTWYTGFGHHSVVFSDPNVIEHIWGGIQYALGTSAGGK